VNTFSETFLLGASLTAHSAEGGNFANDWWRWEQRPGHIGDGTTSHGAAGHFERFEADFDLARKLGHRAHFFSLEWSRLQPTPDTFDEAAFDHYEAVFNTLSTHGIEPVCALHHVTLPQWFAEEGGWQSRGAVARFSLYARRVADAFGSRCRWWIPILEPMHAVEKAHLRGLWPPGRRSLRAGIAALRHMTRAHAAAHRILHEQRPDVLVGAAIRARLFEPRDVNSAWDLKTALREHQRCNRLVLDALTRGCWPKPLRDQPEVRDSLDFIGLSYYGKETTYFRLGPPSGLFARSLSRTAHPQGLRRLLDELGRYGKPLLVTGNGVNTRNDEERCRLLLDHLAVGNRPPRLFSSLLP
jgi:beta-glucosidase